MPPVSLPDLPKNKEFEEFVAAYFNASGHFVERNIEERAEENVLELDVISTDYDETPPRLRLVEAKSGGWGFADIFKVRGWMDYLHITDALLVVQESKDHMDFVKAKAASLDIGLAATATVQDAPQAMAEYIQTDQVSAVDIAMWRFSYWIERNLIKRLHHKKQSQRDRRCFPELMDYYYKVNSGVFLTENIVKRIEALYDAFRAHPHISAKCCGEQTGGDFDDDWADIPQEMFAATYYDCEYTDVQISSFVEHRARLALLKSAVDRKLYQEAGDNTRVEAYFKIMDYTFPLYDFLPASFTQGLDRIAGHPYFRRYPVFWQWFLWVFGGFVLLDYEEQEYQLLSMKSGIPVQEIPNALSAYDALFPNPSGWFAEFDSRKMNVRVLKMFPVPYMGLGANYRRFAYTKTNEFSDLVVTGKYTAANLGRWNNLGVQVLQS